MIPLRRTAECGLTLLEVLVALLLLSTVVVLTSGALIRALGVMGSVQYSSTRYERPARLRTLAMEYIQAEMEFLRNKSYDVLRDASVCNPGPPATISSGRRVPAPDPYLAGEPQVPPLFAAADVVLTTEPIVGVAPSGCAPRRITVLVYLTPTDVPVTVGGSSGVVFLRGETARSSQ